MELPQILDKGLSLNWGVAGFLLIDFCHLFLAIDCEMKRVMTNKMGMHVDLHFVLRTPD